MIDNFVNVSLLQVVIALEFVCVNFSSKMYGFAHDLLGNVVFAIWDDLSAYLSATFQHSHDHGFTASTLHAASAAQALTLRSVHVSGLAADKSLIYFDRCAVRSAEFSERLGLN